ncbi:MAG: hypothetical protein C0433_13855 [Cyclobacterium sp.]|nr:hypothetical protein [Cyclobacterium sp.]
MVLLILKIFISLFFAFTWIPLIKLDYWWVRVFDYPRFKKLSVFATLIIFWILLGREDVGFWYWTACIFVSMSYLVFLVWTYSILGKKMVQKEPYDTEKGIHLIAGNVYQYNRELDYPRSMCSSRLDQIIFRLN